MSTVYFIRNAGSDYRQLSQDALELLKTAAAESGYAFAGEVPIKVHFGEAGNKTFMPPQCYDEIIRYLKDNGASPAFIETNVLYRGSRTTAENHLKTAEAHGFTQIPVIIADGEIGVDYDEIEINKEYFDTCRIGKKYSQYKQYIVTSHFKGHAAAGFGGALKQLAMGFAARSGKMAQHTDISPLVDTDACTACGTCADSCDFDAITISDAAVIDSEACTGCAGCIAVCPEGAISNSWAGSHFCEKLSEYAYAASRGKEIIYINFIHNVTKDCDCVGTAMKPITDNIGVFASIDPVALDTACLDAVQQNSGRKLFEPGRISLQHGEKIGLGTMDYELAEVSR